MTLGNWSWEQFDQLVADKYINVQKHPTAELYIANYSAKVQYDRRWTPETEQSRGLIFDNERNIVSRPFPKFFNIGETRPPGFVLTKQPWIHTKLDGSLGIRFQHKNVTGIATRGSFTSDQALWATDYWNSHHADVQVPDGFTALFEIVFSKNRIVVSYDYEALVLLAVLDTKTGTDIPLWEIDWWNGPVAEQHHGMTNVDDAYAYGTAMTEGEGIVLCWYTPGQPSYRLKCKRPEYVRLHRLITQVSTKTIWSHLKDGHSLDELLENVPDEFYSWVRATSTSLKEEFEALRTQVYDEFAEITKLFVSTNDGIAPSTFTPGLEGWVEYCTMYRPKFARMIQGNPKKSYFFSLLDDKMDRVDEACWEAIRPEFSKPFMELVEET